MLQICSSNFNSGKLHWNSLPFVNHLAVRCLGGPHFESASPCFANLEHLNRMSPVTKKTSSAPAKTEPPAPVQPSMAFGVTIGATSLHAAEKQPLSRQKKNLFALVGIALAIALVFYIQHRPANDDPDAALHPAVKEVDNLAGKKDAGALVQYTKNDDIVVAQRAVKALGNLGDTSALRESLTDTRPEVRSEAISQLSDHATASDLPELSEYLQDSEPAVRISAMRGIASVRDFSMFDYLLPMLADPDINVRRGAIAALEERLGQHFSGYHPTELSTAQPTIARIKAILPNFKKRFDNVNEIEAAKKK